LLGFRFRDPSLFRRALVHRSYCNEHGLDATDSYERLEFLGDAVLELTISSHLYRQFPDADEGQLTKARASLVKGETLADVARRWDLGQRLLVGRGVEASGGRDQDSVLAAAVEAVIAAVYLDQGMEAARRFIAVNMMNELADVTQSLSNGSPPAENPKSRLQEFLQGNGLPTPTYRLVDRQGPDHNPVFTMEVLVADEIIGKGEGGKKSDAERAAAEQALLTLAATAGPDKGTPNP
jgi:ribonuclease-3